MVLGVHTFPANAHDSQHLGACLSKVRLPARSRVLTDKGYCSQANEALLRSRSLHSGIQRKAYRNKPLTSAAKGYNKLVGQVQYKIERDFGSIKCWFGGLRARYVGLLKVHGQHVLEVLAYNLYRLPGDHHVQGVKKTEKMAPQMVLENDYRGTCTENRR